MSVSLRLESTGTVLGAHLLSLRLEVLLSGLLALVAAGHPGREALRLR